MNNRTASGAVSTETLAVFVVIRQSANKIDIVLELYRIPLDPNKVRKYGEIIMGMGSIRKALKDAETAWVEIKTTPINMGIEEFEKRILRTARRHGIVYSGEKGMWLDMAKKCLADPKVPQEIKNLYIVEAHPHELKSAERKLDRACSTLVGLSEWSYAELKEFLDDKSKDQILRTFLRWRVFLPAEAYYKYARLKLRGAKSKQKYLSLNPTVIFRSK